MKTIFVVASAIGMFVSAALMVLDRMTDFSTAAMSFQMPGISAAYLFWGLVGGSAAMGIAVAFIVNAVVYGAAAFILLRVFGIVWKASYGPRTQAR